MATTKAKPAPADPVALPDTAFVTGQIGALDPLEFVAFAVVDGALGEGPREPEGLVEVMALIEGGYRVQLLGENPAARKIAGFDKGVAPVADAGTAAQLVLATLVALVKPPTPRIAIIQGSHAAELARVQKLAMLTEALNGWLNELSNNEWGSVTELPFQFKFGDVHARINGMVDQTGAAVIEIATLAAREVPEDDKIGRVLAEANAQYTFGRLGLDTEQQLWFRYALHADPVSKAALNHALGIARQTAVEAGQFLAKLGAVDATEPDDNDDITEKRVNFGAYL